MAKEIAPTWEVAETEGDPGFEKRARECRERIEKANRNINLGFYDLAIGLYEAVRFNYIKAWGFASLEDYADEVLGFGRRKAYNFVECGRAISENPDLTRERVEALGWSKLSLIAGKILLLPNKTKEYLDRAESSTFRELKTRMREQEEEKSEKKAVREGQVFYLRSARLSGDSAIIVEKSLKAAADMYDLKDYGSVFSKICADWLMFHGEAADISLRDWINFIERGFNVRLQVVKPGEAERQAMQAAKAQSVSEQEQNFLKTALQAASETKDGKSKVTRVAASMELSDDELDSLLS